MKPFKAAEAVRGDSGGMETSSAGGRERSSGSWSTDRGGGAADCLAATAREASLSRSFSEMYSKTDLAFDVRCSSPSASPRYPLSFDSLLPI